MNHVIPVILSGGSSTHLWPLPRKHYPKRFHKLTGGDYTLLQETALRVKHLAEPIVVCNEDHRFMLAEQLHSIGIEPAAILLEPAAKNTAPAIALAALKALEVDPQAVIAVFPADHVIRNQDAFNQALEFATQAEASGSYYQWNNGMFLFKAATYLDTLQQIQPQMVECCRQAYSQALDDLDFIRIDAVAFNRCPSLSFDYAVMEKTDDVRVVSLDAGWSDIGGWLAISDILEKDARHTASIGDVININTHNTLVQNDNKNKQVMTIGLDDLLAMATNNALLVANKVQVREPKQAVEEMVNCERHEHLFHQEVDRPWRNNHSLNNDQHYRVKRITVKPSASLLVQMHHHRTEHSVLVSGTAAEQVAEGSVIKGGRAPLRKHKDIFTKYIEYKLTDPSQKLSIML